MCFHRVTQKTFEIHYFDDVSQKECGAIVYLPVVDCDQVSVNLIASRPDLPHVKRVTLLRLELLNAPLRIRSKK